MKFVVDHLRTYIHDGALSDKFIQTYLAYKEDNYWFSPHYKQGRWDGYKRFVFYDRSKKLYWFGTGVLDKVLIGLELEKIHVDLEDNRDYGYAEPNYLLYDDSGKETIDLRVGKWSYQGSALEAALAKTRGIMVLPTGGGKSEVAAAIIRSIGKKTTFLTHKRNLALQTKERFERRLRCPIGLIGAGEDTIEDITIVMVQTAASIKGRPHLIKHLQETEVLIGDEIHHAESADTWIDQIFKIPAQWRFGLSATPNLSSSGLMLQSLMGEPVYTVDVVELVTRGVLVLPRIWFLDITENPIKSKAYQTVYKEAIIDHQVRNEKILYVAGMFKMENKSCVTLVNRIRHGELLADLFSANGIKTEFIQGKTSEEDRNIYVQRLKEGSLHNIVAMASIMGEGVDIPFLQAIINATGSKGGGDGEDSGRQIIQFLGRILRTFPGKRYADYIDIADKTHKFVKAASLARAVTLQNEGYAPFIKYWSEYIPL